MARRLAAVAFKLSLYGGDPNADYEAIARHMQGRRVNAFDPSKSLVFLKPTQNLEHGGGLVFSEDSQSANLLLKWIQQGTNNHAERSLQRVVASPKAVTTTLGQRTSLRCVAYYSDGTQRDVTDWTIFTPDDASAVEIIDQEASAIPKRRGRHVVVARYLNQVVPIEMIVPLTDRTVDLESQTRANFIDDHVLAKLNDLRLSPSPAADRLSLVRRLYLDLTGRLPTANTVHRFATEQEIRIEELVDRLLDSEEFSEYWTLKLARWLRVKSPGKGKDTQVGGKALVAYHGWIQQQVRGGSGFDEIARQFDHGQW